VVSQAHDRAFAMLSLDLRQRQIESLIFIRQRLPPARNGRRASATPPSVSVPNSTPTVNDRQIIEL
jgi:hypothetical protein